MDISVRGALAGTGFQTLEQARGGVGLARPVGARAIVAALAPPRALQFRLKYFLEHESNDDAAQGASDETFISAVGADSSMVTVGPDHQPVVDVVPGRQVGSPATEVRDAWRNEPHVLLEFDLRRQGDWPRTYTATLLLVEHDNGDLAEEFRKLEDEVGAAIKVAAVAAASTAAGALAGAAIGSIIPGIGTAVGAAVGALAGAAYDGIITAISEGLGDDVFTPIPITLTVDSGWRVAQHPDVDVDRTQAVNELGARYEIQYDWHLVA